MIQHRREPLFIALIALICAASSVLEAQPAMLQRAREGTFLTSAVLQLWKVEEDNIRQVAIPLPFLYPVNEQLQLTIATAPAFSALGNAQSSSLNGFSDTRFGGSYLFRNEKLMATFGINLPSGKHALTAEEFQVANILALHAFDFTSPILGQGLDVSTGMVSAFPLSGMVAGLGAGFLLRGAFEPIENGSTKYNPGEEFTLSAALDYPLQQQKRVMLDAAYTLYSSDKIGSNKVFQSGNRITLQAMAWLPGRNFQLLFMIRDRIRARNKLSLGEKLIPERQNSNGNELELLAILTRPSGAFTTLRAAVEGKFYSNNAYDIGGATIGGLGGGLSRTFSPHLSLEMDARFYFGSLETGADGVSLTGLKATGGLKYRL